MRQEDPMVTMFAAMLEGAAGREPGNAILESEAAGAAALCATVGKRCELPRETDEASFRALELAGVKFLENVPNDALFRYAELPAGWSIKRTDHSMHTKLCDAKGRERASIFYKAAFYDRSAHMSVSRRFGIDAYFNAEHESVAVARVNDQGAFPFTSERFPIDTKEDRHGCGYDHETGQYAVPSKRDIARKQCIVWLAEYYPDWESPTAYWD